MCPKSKEDCASIREKTLTHLLNAAVKVFSLHGYHASSIAAIAKEAGVSKGLTYHYFDSKEALLVALAEERLHRWLPLVIGLEKKEAPLKRLRFLVGFVIDELKEKTEELRFYNSLYLTQDGVQAIEQAMKKYKDSFERLFQAERRLFRDLGFSDPDEEVTFLRSTLQGISLEYMLGPKDYPLERMKKKVISHYERPK